MEKRKISFEKYFERLEGYTTNFEEEIQKVEERIKHENESIKESEKEIEKIGELFGTKNNEFITRAEEKMKPYISSIRSSEEEIKKFEEEKKNLQVKNEEKKKIIEGIIKDATEEYDNTISKLNEEISLKEKKLEKRKNVYFQDCK